MKGINGHRQTRRNFLLQSGLLVATAAVVGPAALGCGAEKGKKAAEVTATEDLMWEHGVLRRLMLIFDEIGSRLTQGLEFPFQVLLDGVDLIKRFIQDYHEKAEENFLFPRFIKAGKLVELVAVLRQQHEAGRRLMEKLLSKATLENLQDPGERTNLAEYFRAFNRMYRAHAAREDTVLFPAFREVVSPKEFDAIGDKFEAEEQRLFGKDGFEKMVAQVANLEKALGLYELLQFMPKL